MDYVFAKAQLLGASGTAKPCAVNMSFGGHSDPHNGFSTESNRIDAALTGTTGRVVVMAGSNDREGNFHVAETIAVNSTTTIDLVVEAGVSRVVVFGSYDFELDSDLCYPDAGIRAGSSVADFQSVGQCGTADARTHLSGISPAIANGRPGSSFRFQHHAAGACDGRRSRDVAD